MDLIVLNSLRDKNSCFGYETNKIKIIDTDLEIKNYPLMKKSDVASVIFNQILLKHDFFSSIKEILK